MPQAPHFNDPEHWHQRAEEARVLAEQMKDEVTKQMMLDIARDFKASRRREPSRKMEKALGEPSLCHVETGTTSGAESSCEMLPGIMLTPAGTDRRGFWVPDNVTHNK